MPKPSHNSFDYDQLEGQDLGLICALRFFDQTQTALHLIKQKNWANSPLHILHGEWVSVHAMYSPLDFFDFEDTICSESDRQKRALKILQALDQSGYDPNRDPQAATTMRHYLLNAHLSPNPDFMWFLTKSIVEVFGGKKDPEADMPWSWALFHTPVVDFWARSYVKFRLDPVTPVHGHSLLGWIWEPWLNPESSELLTRHNLANVITATQILTNAGALWGDADDPTSFLARAQKVLLAQQTFHDLSIPGRDELVAQIRSFLSQKDLEDALRGDPNLATKNSPQKTKSKL